jgi:hypothetical protein
MADKQRTKDPDEIGALWEKRSGNKEYMSGLVNGQEVVCFRNKFATDENRQPQWRVMKSRPKGERSSAPAAAVDRSRAEAPDDADIPF